MAAFGNWTPDTPFRWGSISKSFTALGALSLVERGELALDTPVRTYLPDGVYANKWFPGRPLRLEHLLALTSGLGDLSGTEFNDNTPLPLTEALGRHVRPLLWPPGLQHSYSNVPPGLTAGVIEQVSHQKFEAFMRKRVLAPLAMTQASFKPVGGLPGGFRADGRTEIPYWHVTFPAFGALNASLEEMANFLEMLLNRGKLGGRTVFAPATVAAMLTPLGSLGAAAGLDVGYGAGAYGWVTNGHLFRGHGGDADGYRSRYGILPDAGRGYLIAINTDNPKLLRSLQARVEAALTRDLPPPPVQAW